MVRISTSVAFLASTAVHDVNAIVLTNPGSSIKSKGRVESKQLSSTGSPPKEPEEKKFDKVVAYNLKYPIFLPNNKDYFDSCRISLRADAPKHAEFVFAHRDFELKFKASTENTFPVKFKSLENIVFLNMSNLRLLTDKDGTSLPKLILKEGAFIEVAFNDVGNNLVKYTSLEGDCIQALPDKSTEVSSEVSSDKSTDKSTEVSSGDVKKEPSQATTQKEEVKSTNEDGSRPWWFTGDPFGTSVGLICASAMKIRDSAKTLFSRFSRKQPKTGNDTK